MENSKFDKLYQKNVENIITEKYHRNIGRWTASKAKKSVENMLKKSITKEYVHELNETFVPKKWFNFEKLLKQKPEVESTSFSTGNCHIQISYTYTLSGDECEKFVYGDKKKGIYPPLMKKPKPGGIFFNNEFNEILKNLDFPDPSEDPQNEKFEVSDFELKLSLVFSFNKITYVPNVKPSKRLNPNYIKSIKGNIYFIFNENLDDPILVGNCEYFQKRFANMDPPKPLKDQIKDMWDKPNKDFGLLGSLVGKGIGMGANFLGGGLFSKTVQEESFEISLDPKVSFSNNINGGNIDNKSKEDVSDQLSLVMTDYFDRLNNSLNEENSPLEFLAEYNENGRGQILITLNNNSIFKITLEIK